MAEKLTPQQYAAVTNRGGKLLVSAAAGSGKTKVLVDRLLGYLTDSRDPANLDDFLIITYTKAAAAELRGKIAAKLTERIALEPENRHLQQQMQRLYLTKISTVHAFCTDILREFAYRLDIPGDFRVAEENECQELQLRAMEQLLEEAYERSQEDSDFRAFIDSQGLGRDDRQVPDIILKVYSNSRCHLDPDGWLDWCVKAGQMDNIQDASQTIWGRYLIEDLHRFLDLHMDAMRRCAECASVTDGMEKPAALLGDTLFQLEKLRQSKTWDEILERKNIDYGRLTFSKKCTDVELAERIKAVRTACKQGLERKLRSFSDSSGQVLQDLDTTGAAVQGLVDLTKRFGFYYDRLKKSRRVLDFGDLEQKTLDLLLGTKRWGATSAAAEIGARFREVMVDEYQDSNAVQDAIFSSLTEKKQNCFMVGDVKQSIYQFRLADPGIFLEKYNSFVPTEEAGDRQGRKVLLSSNFRSAGAVISAVNDVFSTCMTPEVGGLVYGEDEILREGIAHVPVVEPEVELHAVPVQEDTYAEEASVTADRICKLLDGKHMVRDGDALRPIVPEDIVILLRSPGSVGAEFRYALEQRGIRCFTGGNQDLLQTEEISTICALLQTINNPLQDIPLVAVLSSRVFGFTADDLAAFRRKNRRVSIYNALRADDSPKTKAFLSVLDTLRSEARMCSLSQLLDLIFTLTRLDSIYAAMRDGVEKTANIQSFCQLITQFESIGNHDLGHFLEHLAAMEERGFPASGEQQPGGCVTIMSIHKSKGLEFPVVFLCGLSRQFNTESARAQVLCDRELGLGLSCVDQKNRVRYPTIAKRAIAAKTVSDGISEEMRVLYVAMTRARDRLIMTYASKYLENDLQDIAMRMDMSDQQLMSADVDCPGGWVLRTALSRTEAGALFALGGRPSHTHSVGPAWSICVTKAGNEQAYYGDSEIRTEALKSETVQRIKQSLSFRYAHIQATVTPSKQTATQLKGRNKDQEAAEDTTQRQNVSRSWRLPAFMESSVRGKEYGNAIHAAMQYIDYSHCSSAEEIDKEVQRMVQSKLLSLEQGEMVDCQCIASFFSTELGRKLQTSNNVLREFKFSILDDAERYTPGTHGEKVLLQGVVDCALIEPDGITIIDFKTDKVTEGMLIDVAARYKPQVQAYASALSRIYKMQVKASYLYFFRLDRFVKVN